MDRQQHISELLVAICGYCTRSERSLQFRAVSTKSELGYRGPAADRWHHRARSLVVSHYSRWLAICRQLLDTGTGTCNGEDLNRSAYWVPAMLDSQGNALIPDQIMVYYKNDNFRLNGANELVEPFPDNLRIIAGNPGTTSPQTDYTGAWQAQKQSASVVVLRIAPTIESKHLSPTALAVATSWRCRLPSPNASMKLLALTCRIKAT